MRKSDVIITIFLVLCAIAVPYNMFLRINNPDLNSWEIFLKMLGLN